MKKAEIMEFQPEEDKVFLFSPAANKFISKMTEDELTIVADFIAQSLRQAYNRAINDKKD